MISLAAITTLGVTGGMAVVQTEGDAFPPEVGGKMFTESAACGMFLNHPECPRGAYAGKQIGVKPGQRQLGDGKNVGGAAFGDVVSRVSRGLCRWEDGDGRATDLGESVSLLNVGLETYSGRRVGWGGLD